MASINPNLTLVVNNGPVNHINSTIQRTNLQALVAEIERDLDHNNEPHAIDAVRRAAVRGLGWSFLANALLAHRYSSRVVEHTLISAAM